MKNILVTGSQGQLGSELSKLAPQFAEFNFIFTDIQELDITDSNAIEQAVKKHGIDFLINCAGYTAVDKAESEPEEAFRLNAMAPGHLALAAKRHNFKLIHISTDYVFDGNACEPYTERNIPNPASVYGKLKFAGERAIIDASCDALIIRTSWLYSEFGHNFVKTILRLAREKEEIKVVFDQVGTPTNAADLADCIMQIISNYPIQGVMMYHYSDEGVCSWYDFASAIIEFEKVDCKVNPVRSDEFKTAAKRPFYSVLDKTAIKRDFSILIPWWKDSLSKCLENIRNTNSSEAYTVKL